MDDIRMILTDREMDIISTMSHDEILIYMKECNKSFREVIISLAKLHQKECQELKVIHQKELASEREIHQKELQRLREIHQNTITTLQSAQLKSSISLSTALRKERDLMNEAFEAEMIKLSENTKKLLEISKSN